MTKKMKLWEIVYLTRIPVGYYYCSAVATNTMFQALSCERPLMANR
jgi:hypothetical protein